MGEYVEPILSGEDFTSPMSDSKEHWRKIYSAIPEKDVRLGPAIANAYINDPKMLGFILARYKFAAKMLEGMDNVLEIGCGEGFGAHAVERAVKNLICTDVLPQKHTHLMRKFHVYDFRDKFWVDPLDAIYMIDVLEHIFPHECPAFFKNVTESLEDDGVLLVGTPNVAARAYASEHSRAGHVNLHSYGSLRNFMRHYFKNVFMFGMNDEVVHTGFGPMSHYLWALCVGPKRY